MFQSVISYHGMHRDHTPGYPKNSHPPGYASSPARACDGGVLGACAPEESFAADGAGGDSSALGGLAEESASPPRAEESPVADCVRVVGGIFDRNQEKEYNVEELRQRLVECGLVGEKSGRPADVFVCTGPQTLCAWLQLVWPEIPILLYIGSSDSRDRGGCLRNGVERISETEWSLVKWSLETADFVAAQDLVLSARVFHHLVGSPGGPGPGPGGHLVGSPGGPGGVKKALLQGVRKRSSAWITVLPPIADVVPGERIFASFKGGGDIAGGGEEGEFAVLGLSPTKNANIWKKRQIAPLGRMLQGLFDAQETYPKMRFVLQTEHLSHLDTMLRYDAWVLLPWDTDPLTFHEHYFSIDSLDELLAGERRVGGAPSSSSSGGKKPPCKKKALFIPSLRYMGRLHLALRWASCDQSSCDQSSCDQSSCDQSSCDEVAPVDSDEGIILGSQGAKTGNDQVAQSPALGGRVEQTFRALPECTKTPDGPRAYLQGHAWPPLAAMYQYPGVLRFESILDLAKKAKLWAARGEDSGATDRIQHEARTFRKKARERARKWWYFTFAVLLEEWEGGKV